MGADTNHVYLFPLIVTIKNWKSMGVDTILCFAEPRNKFLENNATRLIFETIMDQPGIQYIFLDTKLAPKHTIAQTCRMYMPASPYIKVDDQDIMITRVPRDWFTDADVLARRLYEEVDDVGYILNGTGKPNISPSWYTDQIIVSDRILAWRDRDNNSKYISTSPKVTNSQRIDRAWWKKSFEKVNLKDHHDAHVFHPLGEPKNWKKVQPLLKLMFNSTTVEWFNEIHSKYAKLAFPNAPTTTATRSTKSRIRA
ncbi:hypothetical protein WR25_08796 [Diploscapter pachys]|uniref:Nucleotide-diphospho-sugar transferase domain-containing protein n=1 Tax=Diploscapter pachys TaxID=2018661 RepID=A0A2A2L284_9BILA|nr:hypothetical protein WR25_08796 [Diploscapter pachys]